MVKRAPALRAYLASRSPGGIGNLSKVGQQKWRCIECFDPLATQCLNERLVIAASVDRKCSMVEIAGHQDHYASLVPLRRRVRKFRASE
jgi:hypothetical protein